MVDEDLSPDARALERAKMAENQGRHRGNAAWARAQIQAGAQVRKVIWPPGPHVSAGPSPGSIRFADDAGEQVLAMGSMFRADETEDDVWEHHPPAPAAPTMHAPILWILYLFPQLGGPEVVAALVRALESGRGSFVDHLLQIWTDAGDVETGRAIVAVLSKIERGTFHRSLFGDVRVSMDILRQISECRKERGL